MKKVTLFFSAMLLLIASCFTSCEDAQDMEKPLDQPVSMQNDLLVFKTHADFESTLDYLKNNQDRLNHWEAQFKGFLSLRSSYLKFEEQLSRTNDDSEVEELLEANRHLYSIRTVNDETELLPLVDDELIATLFNAEGLVVVEGKLMKLTDDQLFEKELSDKSDLKSSLIEFKNAIELGKAEKSPVVKTIVQYDIKTGRRIETCENKYSKKRLKGEIFKNQVGGLFSSVGARTKHQKKRLGLWTAAKTKQVRLKIEGEYSQEALGDIIYVPISYDKTESDENKISKTFEFCVNVTCTFGITYMQNLHWCRCDDDETRTCETEI
ncbi:hypothetical protein LVD15_20130 [Fulvivirga maritima]|uniref:hypothetical protein n=1 Tax=Fulvivirga maritima TaxID=2904247 RepID=UPI001F219047|nr:hypothetical protein [Fulvivirga maritima]UII25592.1 hypothetical protein LVD15_20130 [Fulvivirga maritima]